MKIQAKVTSDKPAYKEKKKTDKGYVWVYDEKHVEKRWEEKKEKLSKLEKDIKKLREKYEKDLSSDDPRTRAIAAVVGMMDQTAMRVGNEESAREADTYGATTLRVKHVKINGNKVTFDFPGKGAVEQNVELEDAKIVKVLKELMKDKKGDDFVFEVEGKKIWDRAVNRYLSPLNISAKDLRGYRANVLMKEMLKKEKDFDKALDEVAEIVGHKASTLKNQYLDPELVEKHSKKEAALSIRARKYKQVQQSELGGPELQSIPSEEFMGGIYQPITQPPGEKPVDLNRNVDNIRSKVSPRGYEQVKITPRVAVAWRILAPFLPLGAELSSGFRSPQDQANTIRNYWYEKWNGYFAKNFPNRGKTIEDMQKFMNEEYDPQKPGTPPGGPSKAAAQIASPGESRHQSDSAMDIYGINYKLADRVIQWLNKNMSDFVSFNTLQEGDHIHVSINYATWPGPQNMVSMLRKYYHGVQPPQLYVSQSFEPALSKRALLSRDDLGYFRQKMQEFGGGAGGSLALSKLQKQQMRISPNAKPNQLILSAWRSLLPFLPPGAILTSGERTSQDQLRIIDNYWRKAGGDEDYPNVTDPYQKANILNNEYGYVVGGPTSDKPRSHLKGNAFDISGADLDEIVEVIQDVSRYLPIKLRPQIERNNNAVHVGIDSAVYDAEAVAQLAQQMGTRVALYEHDMIKKQAYEDLVDSGAPSELIEAFDPENDSDERGKGTPDLPGDWFEKSPMFRHREEIPEYEIHSEDSPAQLAKDDPEAFFYRGLHKENPDLEKGALEKMLEHNAKFYFIFNYHEREDKDFLDLLQTAAEKLSQQDARAFFYFHLHKKFPELGRGAIVQLIDTNPDSFFDLGLDKEYPDYMESANAARNIKDPNKVELELDQLEQLTSSLMPLLSKKAEPKLNDAGGYDYYSDDLEKAKKVDLIILPEKVEGTNCANCKFVEVLDKKKGLGFCKHPEIQLPVTARMCCALWDNADVKRPWEMPVKMSKRADGLGPIAPMKLRKMEDPDAILKDYDDSEVWVQQKIDGFKTQAIKDKGGSVKLYTRRGEGFEANVPNLVSELEDKMGNGDFWLGELAYLKKGKQSISDVQTIVGSSPEKAQEKLKDGGELVFYVYDLLWDGGNNITKKPYEERYNKLKKSVGKGKLVQVVENYSYADKDQAINDALKAGGEGIVLKPKKSEYKYAAKGSNEPVGEWAKHKPAGKKANKDEVILKEYSKGKEKLVFPMYQHKGDELFEVGQLSGMSKEDEAKIKKDIDAGKQVVVEITFQERMESGKFRHAGWSRFRPDKPAKEVKFSKASFGPTLSKRAADELAIVKDPQSQSEYLKKVLRHIEDNLKTVKDPNHLKWLQRKRYETMSKLQELSGQKPVYEWKDYAKEIIKLQDELNKAKERLLKWERKEMSPAELEELEAQSQEDIMPVRHILESDVYGLEEQIREYQRSPEEVASYEEYYKGQEDESAKYEATPPNPHPDEAEWTPEGTLKYYEQPEEPAKPLPQLSQEPLKLSTRSSQDFAIDKVIPISVHQLAKDDEGSKYEKEKDDPKWDQVLIDDDHKLTRKAIRDHYLKNADKILKEIKGKPVMLYVNTGKANQNILKRKHDDKPIVLNSKDDIEYWADRRLLSIHRVFESETDLGFVDLDLHGDYEQSKAKDYAKKIAAKIKAKYKSSPTIYSSGGSGFHIEFKLGKKMKTDTLRNELRELCEELNEDFEGATTGIVKGKGMRTDVTTLKDNGNIRVPYALHESNGGVKKPVGSGGDDGDDGKWEDQLPGGLADKKKPEDFDPEQLRKGIEAELEHVDDKQLAKEIAMDHLVEDPKYYDKLEKMEKGSSLIMSKRATSVINVDLQRFKDKVLYKIKDLMPDAMPQDIQENLDYIVKPTEQAAQQLANMINEATKRISGWGNSPIVISAMVPYDGGFSDYDWWDARLEGKPVTGFSVKVGGGDFTYFSDGTIDDVLDVGDEESYFKAPTEKSDYFRLIQMLQRGSVEQSDKPLRLYTARPAEDREKLLEMAKSNKWPSGIFLTNSLAFAESFGADYGEERDIWKVIVPQSSLLYDEGGSVGQKQYQLFGGETADIVSAQLLSMGKPKSAGLLLSKHAKKDKPKAGVFIVLPENLAKQFPSLGEHDDSKPHVTVLFIGAVPKNKHDVLVETVKEVAAETKPFELELDDKASYFPASKHSDDCKVAKVNVKSSDLRKLHNALKKALTEAGVDIDDHWPDYKPHVTLEYMEPPKVKYEDDVPSGSCKVKEIEIWGAGSKKTIPLGKTTEASLSIRAKIMPKKPQKIPTGYNAQVAAYPRQDFDLDKFKIIDNLSHNIDFSDINNYGSNFEKPKNVIWTSTLKDGSTDWLQWAKANQIDYGGGKAVILDVSGANVYEVHGMKGYNELVEKYPRELTYQGIPMGKPYYVDWDKVAKDYDGVHIVVPPRPGTWDVEQTLWFNTKHLKPVDIGKIVDVETADIGVKEQSAKDPLSTYKQKRDFEETPEPEGKAEGKNKHRFVIQRHKADKAGEHFDLRLENDEGTMSSWAIPKHKLPTGKDKLLATKTEDHPISYNKFEGDIPKGEYGAGHVDIHDSGTYEEIEKSNNKLVFRLKGKKEKGTYTMVKTDGKKWLIMVSKEDSNGKS